MGPSIDRCVHKNCIIYHDAVHCYGDNILIYFPKISNQLFKNQREMS